jgi:exosortase B
MSTESLSFSSTVLKVVEAAARVLQKLASKIGLMSEDLLFIVPILIGFLALYSPIYLDLSGSVWATDEQGHGPIILVVSLWLFYDKRLALARMQADTAVLAGSVCLVLGLLLYATGIALDIFLFSVSSQIVVLAGLILYFRGPRGLRLVWFPLLFLVFMVPLPEQLVAAVTAPLKTAVSVVASDLLYRLGYPVGRAGVILTIGPYQLLVADACAGLNSMFTLEALGLLYMNLMNHKSAVRNVTLAVLLVPISFAANIIRVMILVLITYYFGDEAGQGFAHGFAGMVLFMVALMMMLVMDNLLGLIFSHKAPAHAHQ